jgi:hypothetical protein
VAHCICICADSIVAIVDSNQPIRSHRAILSHWLHADHDLPTHAQDPSFDYLLLVEQWPKAFGESEDFFTLHGLW